LANIEKSVQEMLSMRQYENMVMSYNLLKVLIDRDYDYMINQTLWVNFIKPIWTGTGRFNQMAIVLLVRALANAINKKNWKAFLNRKKK
jgi:hypothetical protein